MNVMEMTYNIQNLNNHYAYYIDTFDIESWVNCFTADATFDESDFGFGAHVGSDQIRAYGNKLKDEVQILVHIMANHIVKPASADVARGTAFAIVEVLYGNGDHFRMHCTYHDEYQRVGTDWKIKTREVKKSFPIETIK
jgi:hypothetical protein